MSQTPSPSHASDAGSEPKQPVPIWFYVGLLLFVYGVIILIAGIYQFSHPPNTVLAGDHATFWGGLALTIFGLFYVIVFRPGRHRRS